MSFPRGIRPTKEAININDTLSDNFINLDISSHSNDATPIFHLFPMLPIELRLKIFQHTFPRPSVLRLEVNVVISDPSFGLYLSFTHQYFQDNQSIFSTTSKPKPVRKTRMLSLLRTSKESREHYISFFSITLPTNPPKNGVIRISPSEVVYFTNFKHFLRESALKQAINSEKQYRLQNCLSSLKQIAVSVDCFIGAQGTPLHFIRMFGNLSCLTAVMWAGYDDNDWQDETAKRQLRSSIEEFLGRVEVRVKREKEALGMEFGVPKIKFCSGARQLEQL